MSILTQDIYHAAETALERIKEGVEPTADQLAEAPILNIWGVCADDESRLAGKVEGHPRLGSQPITTSPVIYLSPDLKWCRTISRYYRLGKSIADILNEAKRDGEIPDG